MEQSKQTEIIRSALENVKSMVDANTVTGTPIETSNGTVIIPVSKIFLGIATGGVDYFGKKNLNDKNFGGGGGTGVTVAPMGFLVIDPTGKVELLKLEQEPKDAVTKILEMVENTPEFLERFKKVFSKKTDKDSKDEEEKENK